MGKAEKTGWAGKMKDCTNMRVRCVDSQRNSCSRNRVSEEGNRGDEEFGGGEGGV